MSESNPRPSDDPHLHELLVAYLDGELDTDEARRLEERVANEPAVERELQMLDRSWQALDALPTAKVSEEFTHTTVEMIAIAARKGRGSTRRVRAARHLWSWLLMSAGCLLAGVLGYVTVTQTQADPNRRLVEDLPMLEQLDAYLYVDDIEFLRMLQEEGLFDSEADDDF